MKKRSLPPPPPKEWTPATEHDSRGPGAYCPRCNSYSVCCDCLAYHWSHRELPVCLFPDSVEKTYDRSLGKFIEIYKDSA